ncbi:hypothetical protein QJ854_gp542 [Moumouvirus goulette]|uniref:Uncharacterized protein n=1 Tax=Moumouvirus goulette TaxID=1247379 RepID=M1NMH1_9VIRU|nr:hypothetical protein QJ854_gp542 [Moumouvirus goulette]AGF85240.1 hypothetical protein glt_00431 [Moumouvirus goulette]
MTENTNIIEPIDHINYIAKQCISLVYLHPVKLDIIFKEITEDVFDYEIFDDYCEYEDEDDTKKEFEIIKNIKLSTLLSDAKLKKITGYSKSTGNSDDRGGGCGNYNIPVEEFTYTIVNKNGITIRDVLEIIYRLKGSKYDFWYELLTLVEVKKQTNNYIKFKVDFDYGS